jgi:hypothetical protein
VGQIYFSRKKVDKTGGNIKMLNENIKLKQKKKEGKKVMT